MCNTLHKHKSVTKSTFTNPVKGSVCITMMTYTKSNRVLSQYKFYSTVWTVVFTDHLNLSHSLKIEKCIQYAPHTCCSPTHTFDYRVKPQKAHKFTRETTQTRIPGLPASHVHNNVCAVCLSFCLSLSHTHTCTHTRIHIHTLHEGFFFTVSKYCVLRMY